MGAAVPLRRNGIRRLVGVSPVPGEATAVSGSGGLTVFLELHSVLAG
jgi:hypothetical protein